ncbi:L-serine ammonia-lyase, iron-sulfur-dependent, subunit alpha [Sphingomonas sp. MMS24-JH45]
MPAVLRYYRDFWPGADRAGMHDFLLTASAIGAMTELNASISGAEVGCQGEVGTASNRRRPGSPRRWAPTERQIENAAEIAMEHHLGMTCDPIAGLVQVLVHQRNAFGAIKAINAASLSLRGDGTHIVSLDQVIETMMRTGTDMHAEYKETSQGGLAVSFPNA